MAAFLLYALLAFNCTSSWFWLKHSEFLFQFPTKVLRTTKYYKISCGHDSGETNNLTFSTWFYHFYYKRNTYTLFSNRFKTSKHGYQLFLQHVREIFLSAVSTFGVRLLDIFEIVIFSFERVVNFENYPGNVYYLNYWSELVLSSPCPDFSSEFISLHRCLAVQCHLYSLPTNASSY